jgi:HK97 family phage major capsid protein
MTLAKILSKKAEDLNEKEIEFLKLHASELSAADKKRFAKEIGEKEEEEDDEEEEEEEEGEDEDDDDDEDEKGMSVDDVKSLIGKEASRALGKKIDKVASEIVDKFQAGLKDQRAKILGKKKIAEGKDKHADSVTRDFLKALMDGDIGKAKAMTTSKVDDAKAGLLIPEELMTEVLRIAQTGYGIARSDMMYLPFSGPGNSRKIPTLATGVTVHWTGEGEKKKGTTPTFGIVEQTLKKLAAIVPMTEEIVEDSSVNLTNLVAVLITEAITKEEDIKFFTGTGSVWTGVLENGSVNKVYQAVAGIDHLTADDLLKMIDETPAGALNGAKFYMNRTALSVIRKLKDENKNYIYQNPGQNMPGTIWNYPVTLSEAFPAAKDVTAGHPYILFGNLKQGCIFGDKQQIKVKMLDQATITDADGETVINLAEEDMVAFRFVERVGYVVALPDALTVLDAGTEPVS